MVWRTHGNICTSFFSMPSASFPLNAYWSFFIGVFDLVGAIDETQGPHAGIDVSTTTVLIFPSLFSNNEQAPNTCELWLLHYEVDWWPSLLGLYREKWESYKNAWCFVAITFPSQSLPQEMYFTLVIWFSFTVSACQEFMTTRKIIYRTEAHKMCHLDNAH